MCFFIFSGDDLSCIVLGMATGTCFVDSGVCAVNQENDGGVSVRALERGDVMCEH